MENKEVIKNIEKLIISICKKLAQNNRGAIFIIKESGLNYDLLFENDKVPFDIFKEKRRLEALALGDIDGAFIIDSKGKLINYGANIKNVKTRLNLGGTRVNAGFSASFQGNTAFILSQEDKTIKIFKNGNLISEMNALNKDLEKNIESNPSILESLGVGAISQAGIIPVTTLFPQLSVLAQNIGILVSSGIVFFGSTAIYYLYKSIKGGKNG